MEGLPNRPFQPSLKCQLCLRTPVSDLSGLNIKPGDDSERVDADTPSRRRGEIRPSFAWSLHPQTQEGAGKAGADLAPAVRCAKSTRRKTAQQHTGVANHSAFPARWLDGLCRALPGAEFLLASLASRIG